MTSVRNAECGVWNERLKYFAGLQLFGLALCLVIAGVAAAASWQWIDGQQVQNRMKEGSGLWFIDVRSAAAYEAAHIEGSVNIPSDVLAHKKFPVYKTIMLVDDSLGQKTAREAAEALVKNGNERVYVTEGGLGSWRMEGLPLVESNPIVRNVTESELKWAIANSVPMRIFDLRDLKAQKQGTLQNSETVAGKTLGERVQNLQKILADEGKKKDLSAKIQKVKPVVLVFAASDDAEGFIRKITQAAKCDIRYLIGGYEAVVSEKMRGLQTAGSCPTCPRRGK